MKKMSVFVSAIATCATAMLVSAQPAHAISENYRRQLEQRHCTQADDVQQSVTSKASPFVKHYDGMSIKRDKLGIVTVDGKPAAQDKQTASATVYSQGLYRIIVHTNGAVGVIQNGKMLGYAQ